MKKAKARTASLNSPAALAPRAAVVASALQLAIAAHQAGRLAEAEKRYCDLLDEHPYHPDVLHYLGMLRHQAGQSAVGLELIERALALAPDYIDARNNLGNVQKELGMAAEAEASYRKVIAATPDFAPAYNNLGVMLREQGKLAEAIEVYRQCLELTPDFVGCLTNFSHALLQAGQRSEAITAYRKAVLLAPQDGETYRHLARGLVSDGRKAEALEVYEKWQVLQPDNPEIGHLIAACSDTVAPERANDGFVQTTFDRFAQSFDKVLEGLQYRAPVLCGDLVGQLLGAPERRLDVLDAGCGTGLCAPFLSPHARTLCGVDLSPKMLERAVERGGYTHLEAAELTAWLDAHPQAYDLIVSADTLCYFGDLSSFATAASAALRPLGNLVFTLEASAAATAGAAADFTLHPHGRYSHHERYATGMLEAAGLTIREVQHVVLRTEMKLPVAGLLIAAQRPG